MFHRLVSSNVRSIRQLSTRAKQAIPSDDHDLIYGTSSVLAVLHAAKRKPMRVYLQEHQQELKKKKDSSLVDEIVDQCRSKNVPLVFTDKGHLNNMTLNKPHQGVVLKTSRLEPVRISHLSPMDGSTSAANPNRAPFWIALDEVQDPQNLGSILSAPLSAAVSKVSAGAVEFIDIYSTNNLVKFLKACEGWNVVGADVGAETTLSVQEFAQLSRQPTILVLGNEGTGIRTNVKSCCSAFTSIPGRPTQFKGDVDSLNVGVAAGVLIASATLYA
ncbi:hypothetical protein DFQ28_006698 [Apophysomyces sp. BC1034]|nr:hypothetical protein DFQ30_004851 [Apophysomyces sp. BC1015]KAG0174194.1 hypothetical protein DFQ29_007568 [Apophysomyces sp. BC1021]KAG0187233.1 hypothetical protein DFQ28_006698 [Apophysomyces sp. BC1034]